MNLKPQKEGKLTTGLEARERRNSSEKKNEK
jgi:hypothetical protein